jgi:hypothetical protein
MNKKIFIASKDDTIIETIKNVFTKFNVFTFSEKKAFDTENSLIIIDDIEVDMDLKVENVINISGKNIKDAISISRPFYLRDLLSTVENCLTKNELKFNGFIVKNNILKIGNIEISFGNKEIEVIRFLYYKNSNRKELLKNIWNCDENLETKVLENAINKIRQKFKSFDINNFILVNFGNYEINPIYKNIS